MGLAKPSAGGSNPSHPNRVRFPPTLPTPVNQLRLAAYLNDYADAPYIIAGFTKGFKLGFNGVQSSLVSKNNQSILQFHNQAKEKIDSELRDGKINGPYDFIPLKNFKQNPISIIQKKDPSKFRLLVNLSYPYDHRSVNFNIPQSESKVSYSTILDAIKIIRPMDKSFLAKADIKDAFRLIPVHSSDYNLLGFKFDDNFFFDMTLPMGCSSSCKIFERFSDALLFILSGNMLRRVSLSDALPHGLVVNSRHSEY